LWRTRTFWIVSFGAIQIVWFKRDLRVRDHEPLSLAARRGPVLPLYIVEPLLWKQPDSAAQHWDVISRALAELRESLAAIGAPLIVRSGEVTMVLADLVAELPPMSHMWAYEETGNEWTFARDRAVVAWARTNRVVFTEIPHDFVVRRLRNRDDWSAIARERLGKPLLPVPSGLTAARTKSHEPIHPGQIPSAAMLGLSVQANVGRSNAGELAARATLKSFLETRSIGYEKNISSPITAVDGCSRLSQHLSYGTISLREVIARTRRVGATTPERRFSMRAYEERLHWRSHFIQKLEDQPTLEKVSYIKSFDGIRLDPETNAIGQQRFEAWATGNTGYPMIDACMRSLNETGWINFRMRAMLVSFASYDLWLHWRSTSVYLARAFIDYEPGIHYPQIQMQSGTTGINTIRMYDPVKQGLDHDPTGDFVRRWVPELRDVAEGAVHQPWLLADSLFGAPKNYRPPIVQHSEAVAAAWKHIDRIKQSARQSGQAALVHEKHGSRRPLATQRFGVPKSRRK
jgi:deoxyribodipyrimidine photo-lyase